MSAGIKKRIKRRLKKPTSVDKSKGKEINVIVSVDKNGGNNGNGQTIGWLKVSDEGCNGTKGRRGQGGNESISIFKDFRNSS